MPPAEVTNSCDAPDKWIGYGHVNCGECTALVFLRDNGGDGTCGTFCGIQGLGCVEGYDAPVKNQCILKKASSKACTYNFKAHTAVCKCSA